MTEPEYRAEMFDKDHNYIGTTTGYYVPTNPQDDVDCESCQ